MTDGSKNSLTVEVAGDNGATLTFHKLSGADSDINFEVSVQANPFAGATEASTFDSGPPSQLFQQMADHWRGWDGELVWGDLEERVKLSATMNTTGHVILFVQIRGHDYESGLTTSVSLAAGQLEALANSMVTLFNL